MHTYLSIYRTYISPVASAAIASATLLIGKRERLATWTPWSASSSIYTFYVRMCVHIYILITCRQRSHGLCNIAQRKSREISYVDSVVCVLAQLEWQRDGR